MNAMPTDFDNLWEYWVKEDYEEYYKIYNRVMTPKFYNEMNESRIPIKVFFRGNDYRSSKAYDKNMNLEEAIKLLFPFAHENDEFLERFKTVDVSTSNVKLSKKFKLGELYKIFANPDGYLYLTVKI